MNKYRFLKDFDFVDIGDMQFTVFMKLLRAKTNEIKKQNALGMQELNKFITTAKTGELKNGRKSR